MTRSFAALVAAASLALPAALATAQGTPPPSGPMPPCAPGQMPTPESPCMLPPCAEGQMPSPNNPCIVMAPGGQFPGGPPMPPGGGPGMPPGGPPMPGGPGMGPGGPSQMGGPMLNRVWRFNAESEAYNAAANVLNVTVTKIANLPKAMAQQAEEIVDQDAFVLFSATTKVYDAEGKRLPKEVRYDTLLDDADTVQVSGKIMPPAKWHKDEDDTPVTTIRAKRVKITA